MVSKLEAVARRERIQALEIEGVTAPRVIAQRLGIPLGIVQRDLRAMNRAWAKSQKTLAVRHCYQRRLVARAGARYRQLFGAWERSKQDYERRREPVRTAAGDGTETVETEVVLENRMADVAYMREMRENDNHVADVLGLRAPPES